MATNEHRLSRKEMEAVIAAGGSVLYGGVILTTVGELPTQAQLAKGNPEEEKVTLADIQKQIADLQAQQALLIPSGEQKSEDNKDDGAGKDKKDK